MPKFSFAWRAMENFVQIFPYISPSTRRRKRDVILVVSRESPDSAERRTHGDRDAHAHTSAT